MSYDIASREFDPILRVKEITNSLGNLVSEYLSELTVTTNPYVPDLLTVGTATTYILVIETTDIASQVASTETVIYTSLVTDTYDDIINGLVASATDNNPTLVFQSNIDYVRDEDKYLTFATVVGNRISAMPLLTNVAVTTQQVQTSSGQPAAYLMYGPQPECGYPRLTTTSMFSTDSISKKYNSGSVELDLGGGLQFYPYKESYLQFDVKVVVESGNYEDVLEGRTPSSSFILNRLQRKLQQENYKQSFIENIDATFKYGSVVPSPVVAATQYADVSACTFTFDLVDRYIDVEGGIMEIVEIRDAGFRNNGGTVDTIPVPDTDIDRNA